MTRLANQIECLYVRAMQPFNLDVRPLPEDVTSEILKKLLPICPRCASSTAELHTYGKLSCVISEGQAHTVKQVIAEMNSHQWKMLANRNDFDPFREALVIYVVVCANGNGGVALAVLSPSELYGLHSLHHFEKLAGDEIAELSPLLSFERRL